MRVMLVAASALLLLSVCSCAGSLGLSVGKDGTLQRSGKPFRGIGVNYFDAFYRTLGDPKNTTYRDGFKILKDRGIPFVRFMACGYWPKENDLYLKDKDAYFKLMDGVVKSAEENGIGLIPSLFFCHSTVPDLVGEPMLEWGNPKSKTIAFLRQYTREMVTRYRSSPAIWGCSSTDFGGDFHGLAGNVFSREVRIGQRTRGGQRA